VGVAPDDVASEERSRPESDLENVLERCEPDGGPIRGSSGEPAFEREGLEDAKKDEAGRDGDGVAGRCGDGPEERPDRAIGENAEEIGARLADPDGDGPTELMTPGADPIHGSSPAIDDDRTEVGAQSPLDDEAAKAVVVGKHTGQGPESTEGVEVDASKHHDRAESVIDGSKGLVLKNLTPKIDIDDEGFPAGCQGRGVGDPVQAMNEACLRIAEEWDGLREEVGGGKDIGIADDDDLAGSFLG